MEGKRVAVLEGPSATSRRRDHLALTYAAGAPTGAPLLSTSLPVQSAAIRGGEVHAFFNGLLPEGHSRDALAYDFGVDSGDALGLLTALGRDCAGALVLIPPDLEPPGDGYWEPITDSEVAEHLARLRIEPLGVDGRIRVSLAGMQAKLLLARDADQRWCRPADGAPSTHILKPATPLIEDSVMTEGFCLNLARELGVASAQCAIATFGQMSTLVVRRFDREERGGQVTRLHQEDFCQALGLEPQAKYQNSADGGPSFLAMANVLMQWARPRALEQLLDLMVVNVLIGNCDAHAKNYSILHPTRGPITLSPAYDLMCTIHDKRIETAMGLWVNGVRDIHSVTANDLIAEGANWGLPTGAVARRVAELLAHLPKAMELAARDTPPRETVVRAIQAHVARMTQG